MLASAAFDSGRDGERGAAARRCSWQRPIQEPTVRRCVLITECLQNDLFLNPACRLYLSDSEVKKMLVAKRSHEDDVFEVKVAAVA